MAALRAYVREHRRLPLPYRGGPDKPLALWWNAQRRALRDGGLTHEQRRDVDTLVAEVAALNRRPAVQVQQNARLRARIVAQAEHALMNNRHLLPRDKPILEIRIAYPDATAVELARKMNLTTSAFESRLRNAIKRSPQRPAKAADARWRSENLVRAGEAASMIGVEMKHLDKILERGGISTFPTPGVHRMFRRAEVERVRQSLAETVLAFAEQASALAEQTGECH